MSTSATPRQLVGVLAGRAAVVGDNHSSGIGKPDGRRSPDHDAARALVDAWIVYSREGAFSGGCVVVATSSEYDSKPGPVRDALATMRERWLGLLADQMDEPANDSVDPRTAAFAVDACLAAANIAYRLDDEQAYDRARTAIALLVGPRPSGTAGAEAGG